MELKMFGGLRLRVAVAGEESEYSVRPSQMLLTFIIPNRL